MDDSRYKPSSAETREILAQYSACCYACGRSGATLELDHIYGDPSQRGVAYLAPLCSEKNAQEGGVKGAIRRFNLDGEEYPCLIRQLDPQSLLGRAAEHFAEHRMPLAYACAAKAFAVAKEIYSDEKHTRSEAAALAIRYARHSQLSDFIHAAVVECGMPILGLDSKYVNRPLLVAEVAKIWSEVGHARAAAKLLRDAAILRKTWRENLKDFEEATEWRREKVIELAAQGELEDCSVRAIRARLKEKMRDNIRVNYESIFYWLYTERGDLHNALKMLDYRAAKIKRLVSVGNVSITFNNIAEILARHIAVRMHDNRQKRLSDKFEWELKWLIDHAVPHGWRACEMRKGANESLFAVLREPLTRRGVAPAAVNWICSPRRLNRDTFATLRTFAKQLVI